MVILLINSQNINGKIILVPRECNSTSLSERSVYGAIARQGYFLWACHAAAGERVVLFEKKCIIGMLLMLSGRMCTDGENLQVIVGVLCAADTLMISLL